MTEVKENNTALWQTFLQQEKLTVEQLEAFQLYCQLLLSWNDQFNITALITDKQVIHGHFQDSLALERYIDLTTISGIADVGSGGGFPGIPLKIKYPHLQVVLIEVNNKKRTFLTEVVDRLGLKNVEIYGLDWRTFLRKTDYPIDIFCARASLPVEELLRVFKPSSPYKTAKLVYWAAIQWEPTAQEQGYITKTATYKSGNKVRKLVVLEAPKID